MRSIITLAIFALSVLSASAQYGQSILNLRISDNSQFKVYIDGNPAGRVSNSIKINNLQPGKHMLQVVRINYEWGRPYEEVVYGSGIVLTANAESWVTVLPELRRIKFDNIVAFNTPCPKPNHGSLYQPVMPGNQCSTDAPVFVPVAPVGPCAMNPNDFGQLKRTIDNAGFESTRLTIFKQAAAYNYFTTAQVRELMDLFWFENTKLEVAKVAYNKTIDQNNYYLVNNEFSFSSSVNQLGEYIAMR
ncbi:MAG TPA: DUF4476 domain-containing protein [Chitinophagales bacterium]|nr:DUF4476 domain-containing protein [Chitinophagales bacterium]